MASSNSVTVSGNFSNALMNRSNSRLRMPRYLLSVAKLLRSALVAS